LSYPFLDHTQIKNFKAEREWIIEIVDIYNITLITSSCGCPTFHKHDKGYAICNLVGNASTNGKTTTSS
jgi:hypothetical protein